MTETNVGSPKGREPYGDTGTVVVVRVTPHQGGREDRPQGEGCQVAGYPDAERVCEMQSAETVLGVLRERGPHRRHGIATGEPRARKRARVVRTEGRRKRACRTAGTSPPAYRCRDATAALRRCKVRAGARTAGVRTRSVRRVPLLP